MYNVSPVLFCSTWTLVCFFYTSSVSVSSSFTCLYFQPCPWIGHAPSVVRNPLAPSQYPYIHIPSHRPLMSLCLVFPLSIWISPHTCHPWKSPFKNGSLEIYLKQPILPRHWMPYTTKSAHAVESTTANTWQHSTKLCESWNPIPVWLQVTRNCQELPGMTNWPLPEWFRNRTGSATQTWSSCSRNQSNQGCTGTTGKRKCEKGAPFMLTLNFPYL
jgi:hypothetical protein